MALRVLLADESSTIKKVFQLALQDFAVEVRPVNIGVDVASVAASFKPDIIFADVLLQKKNGYEVCNELKGNETLNSIPVVLMWSGFMEFDEDKYQASQADASLEKPFDVAALRKLVTDLVPRTKNQRLSQFLTFPKVTSDDKRPDILEEEETPETNNDDFKAVPIPKMKGQGGGDKYRLNLKPEELDPKHIPVDYDLPPEKMKVDDLLKSDESGAGQDEFQLRETKKPAAKAASPGGPPPLPSTTNTRSETIVLEDEPEEEMVDLTRTVPPPPPASRAKTALAQATEVPTLSAEQVEEIVRRQSLEVIESVVWKVLPELATQIIERELERLLKERDSHSV